MGPYFGYGKLGTPCQENDSRRLIQETFDRQQCNTEKLLNLGALKSYPQYSMFVFLCHYHSSKLNNWLPVECIVVIQFTFVVQNNSIIYLMHTKNYES